MDKNLEQIRKKLPYRYGAAIAKELIGKGIGSDQVRMVFNEEITNADTVELVLNAAYTLIEKKKRIDNLKQKANTF